MGLVIHQYDICLIQLDPTIGYEIKKTRPCLVLSPDEMNDAIQTIIIAPVTTRSHAYPTRVQVSFEGKTGWIVLDHIRTVDRRRLIKRSGRLESKRIEQVKRVLQEMLID